MNDHVISAGRLASVFKAKKMPASKQRSLAGKYTLSIQLLSLAVFSWAFFGWINETWLFWWDNPIWLNRYTEYAIILGFGIWRITSEQNPYTKRRLSVLVAVVTVLWWLIPWALPFFEPYIGFLGVQPAFPSLHTPGTMTFFAVLLAVTLFGRRVICGWGCPCVGVRETVGFPFRHVTPRGKWAWGLRHSKWIFFALYMVAIVVLLFPPNSWSVKFIGFFALVIGLPYFISMLLSPVIGNRAYCRYLCPFGATFGVLNRIGFYKIEFDADTCNDCGICDQVCDMGIPVLAQGRTKGKIDVADCMGCGRCVTECPKNSLSFHDARNFFIPARRDRTWLLDWATGKLTRSRWHVAIFVGLLAFVAAVSWSAHQNIGTPFELATTMWDSLCLTH
jgi:polyferredoxin